MKIVKKIIRRLRKLTKTQSFALNRLDLKLKPYLNFRNGFFIEAGANDGVKYSNTLYFERYKSWTGLLVEPIPELATKCKTNRPNCIVENYALVPLDYPENYVEMQFCGLMSIVEGAMRSEQEAIRHVQKGYEIQKGIAAPYTLNVPAKSLTRILDQHSIERIDFFSLDVEGYELNVLKGLDFDKYKPTFMLIEARYREEIDSFLGPLYKPIAELSHHDVLYRLDQI